jgi:hypothetical protein
MSEVTFDQNLDIAYATLWDIRRKNPPLATYAYSNYQFYNTFFRGNVKTVGKALEGHVTLSSEGNATHSGFWAQDSLIKDNINQRYRLGWAKATGGMMWNLIEQDINQSPAQIYDVWKQQYNSCVKDMVEEVLDAMINGRNSATDTNRPYSIFQWIAQGTINSTGGFTGYYACYNDGSTPGARFHRGGINAGTYTDWANYFADHNSNIDDSLLTILDTAARKLNFQPPVIPEKLPMDKMNYAFYTNDTVIKNLNSYFAKADDNMGYRPDSHYNTPTFNRIPMIYTPPLDTANTSVYGTNPILGLNHNFIYPVILRNWDFRITKQVANLRHTVMELYMDLVYQIWCNSSPKYAGFLVTNNTVTPTSP